MRGEERGGGAGFMDGGREIVFIRIACKKKKR